MRSIPLIPAGIWKSSCMAIRKGGETSDPRIRSSVWHGLRARQGLPRAYLARPCRPFWLGLSRGCRPALQGVPIWLSDGDDCSSSKRAAMRSIPLIPAGIWKSSCMAVRKGGETSDPQCWHGWWDWHGCGISVCACKTLFLRSGRVVAWCLPWQLG